MTSRSLHRIFLCLILFFLSSCERPEGTAEQKATLPVQEVRVATVSEQLMAEENEVMGTVTAFERATISARVSGVIRDLPIELGSTVRQGDVLARIGAEEIAARLSEAEARLEQARRNVERERRLLEKDAATREGVKDLEEALRIAEAAHREARTMFGYTTVTAPFDGLVAQKLVNSGDLASPGTPLLVLENNRRLQILFEVPEAFALQIQKDKELPVSVPAADFSGTGQVEEIAPVADPLSRTATVKLAIETQPRLRPGQFARVTLSGKANTALFVPESAVLKFGQMEKTFVVQNDTARMRLVRSGASSKGQVEILSGLVGGEQVVVENASRLIDGQPIRIVQ